MKSKLIGYAFISIIALVLLFIGIKLISTEKEIEFDQMTEEFKTYEGQVYGTYFSIVYQSEVSYKSNIDSIFKSIDQAASAYISDSEINQLNLRKSLPNSSLILRKHFKKAQQLYDLTETYFDPTLSPIIELWGFGKNTIPAVDSLKIAEAMQRVGFSESYTIDETRIELKNDAVINFTAMGEGMAIDQIFNYLEQQNLKDFKVEIGGELRTKGSSPKQKPWLIGIENPLADDNPDLNQFLATIEVSNFALSTSGSYRKFFVDEAGIKRSHIIDPKSGYPVSHTLVSASITAPESTTADAVATAIMAMGVEKGKAFIIKDKQLEAFLIYETEDGLDYWRSTEDFNLQL